MAARSETSIFGPGPNDAWQELAGDETEGEYIPCDDGPYICPETCKLDTQAFVPTNALTEPLRVHASLSSTIPVEATLSVRALAEGVDCSPIR